MAKEKKERSKWGWLSPRELQKYKEKEGKEVKEYESQRKKEAYQKSSLGKASRGVTTAFSFIKSPSKFLYSRHQSGRPKGTLDKRYAAYGGVYNFRKIQAQQRRLQRIAAMQRATISPQEQAVINQVRQQQMSNAQNPEMRIVPDTNGKIDMKKYFQDIDSAANLID